MTLAIDRVAEDAVFRELETAGIGLEAISEERGRVSVGDGGKSLRVVIDPIDGSLNSKRSLPLYSMSIAVATGETMADVGFGYVADLAHSEEWWAVRGGGARLGGAEIRAAEGGRLEILGVEAAEPALVAAAAHGLERAGAHRLRMIGSIALSLCYVASARFDGLVTLRGARSVDAAAGQLIVTEAGGAVAFPDAGDGAHGAPLSLDMRSRVFAGADRTILDRLVELGLPS